jgi:hypothetical protein
MDTLIEMRRKAPLGFWAKADNARFVACLLWQGGISDECLSGAATRSGYHGTPLIATSEAFLRESALALELIVKAVIAQKIEVDGGAKAVPTIHDVPVLWGKAALPALAVEDRRRLLRVKSLLIWSSRYAAPKSDFRYYQEEDDFEAVGPPAPRFGGDFSSSHGILDWENFDRIYQIAGREFFRLRPPHHLRV